MPKPRRSPTATVVVPLLGFVLLAGCEGPQGPPGVQGPEGPEGPQGPQGPAGEDASANCVQCHVSDVFLVYKMVQYANSKHGSGDNVARAVNEECAPCHAHEGFVDRIETGAKTSTAAADHQTPINCRTCHRIHETYTAADLELRSETPVTLWMGDQIGVEMTVDIGEGNLCANCHQPRARDSDAYYAELFGTGTEMAITSSRFGPHHGPQSTMLTGQGGYEYDGVAYVSSPHRNAEDGCVTCHMAEPAYADEAGGHTWSPKRDNGEIWVVGCDGNGSGCHDVSTDDSEDVLRDDAEAEQANIWDDADDDEEVDSTGDTGLLVDLKVKLIQIGILAENDRSVTSETTMWPLDIAGAVWNYQFVREDHSHGLHNFRYATKLLESSIAAVDAYIATLP